MTQWMHIVVKIEICTKINIDEIKSAKNSNKQMEYILPLNNIKWLVISYVLVSMLRIGCNVKQMKSIQFFNPSSVMYMGAQVNSSAIANIYWLIQRFKYQSFGYQVHFKSI